MQRVADVLATQGAVGFDRFTNLEAATAVSADGLTIVGFGTRRIPGQRQAWRAVLDSPFAADTDADGVLDSGDNCVLVANPGQLDTDGDGFGNACDGDLNNSGLVTAADFAILRSVLNQSSSASLTAATADLNGSGVVTETDYAILRSLIGTAPGPSGLR